MDPHANDRLGGRSVKGPVYRYQSVKSILASGLDQQPLPQLIVRPPVEHANIRGADYYGDSAKQAEGVGGC